MSANATTKKSSETDWERVDAMSDEDIDTSDIPPLDEDFWENAEVRMPRNKVPITIRLDPDVLTLIGLIKWRRRVQTRLSKRV